MLHLYSNNGYANAGRRLSTYSWDDFLYVFAAMIHISFEKHLYKQMSCTYLQSWIKIFVLEHLRGKLFIFDEECKLHLTYTETRCYTVSRKLTWTLPATEWTSVTT